MNLPKTKPQDALSVIDAIYKRRAVRSYKAENVDPDALRMLLAAAVQAPTAMHEEPWVFTVIQDQKLLRRLSDDAKKAARAELKGIPAAHARHAEEMLADPDFNIFYNAGTLVVIWAKPMGAFVEADCWLAAENLMLAACGMGYGSCVIGFALGALKTPEWKERLGVHEKMTPVAPLILGVPDQLPLAVARKPPEILSWQ